VICRTKLRCCNDVAGIIYAVGGLTNAGDTMSTVEMYDPLIGKWSVVEPMSTLRSRVGVTVMNGLLYAIGGFNGYERLRTVEVFDTEQRKWKEVRG
jgi:kelch-like protein 18